MQHENSHLFYLSFVFGFALYHPPVLSEARHRQYRETPVPHVSGCPAELCVEVPADIVALRSWFQRLLSITPPSGRFPVRLRFFNTFQKPGTLQTGVIQLPSIGEINKKRKCCWLS